MTINQIGMKKLTFIILAAFGLFNQGCHPDKCCSPPQSEMYIIAQKDSVQWLANPDGTMAHDTINIKGIGVNSTSLQEVLGFQIKYNGAGNYKLVSGQVSFSTTAGHGTPVTNYKLDSLFNNSLNIDNYDQGSNTISGTFNVKFVDPNTDNHKDISFLEGKFNVALHK
ncbi:MAG: hypothetical protein JWP37_3377 [Mucilaginibacter sp.]|nr:hypothetical protein [Mucilaginibacter sp.]